MTHTTRDSARMRYETPSLPVSSQAAVSSNKNSGWGATIGNIGQTTPAQLTRDLTLTLNSSSMSNDNDWCRTVAVLSRRVPFW